VIDKENIVELKLISDLYASKNITSINIEFVESIACDAITEAIETDPEDGSLLILKTYPLLVPALIKVIKKNFPNILYRIEKLLPLA